MPIYSQSASIAGGVELTAEQSAALAAVVHGVCTIDVGLSSNGTAIESHNNELSALRYDDAVAYNSRHIIDNLPGYTGGDVILRLLISLSFSGDVAEFVHLDILYSWLEENPGVQWASVAYDYDVDWEPDLEGLLWDRVHILELTIPEARVSDTAKFIALKITRDGTHINDNFASNLYIHKIELAYTGWGIDLRPVAP